MKNSCARNYDVADKISLFLRKNVCFANVLENMKKEIAFAYLFSMDFRNLIFLIKGMKIITSIKSMGPWVMDMKKCIKMKFSLNQVLGIF